MDIRTGLDGLKSLLGVSPAATPSPQQSRSSSASGASALGSDRATFSSAGSEASLAAVEPGVRTDKVASIQAALAAGTYNVQSSAVASRVVDAMLASAQ